MPRAPQEISRFLRNPLKPAVLAMSRPDAKKNLATLVTAFGAHAMLRELANLVLIMGNRDTIDGMAAGSQAVLTQVRGRSSSSSRPAFARLSLRCVGVSLSLAWSLPPRGASLQSLPPLHCIARSSSSSTRTTCTDPSPTRSTTLKQTLRTCTCSPA